MIFKETILTAIPFRKNACTADDLLNTIRQGNLNTHRNANDLVKHIVSEAVCFPTHFKGAGLGKHVLDIFEEELASEVTT